MERDDPAHPPGTVVRVMQDGYTIHDRLLRPARVFVNKRRSETTDASNAAAPNAKSKPRSPDQPD